MRVKVKGGYHDGRKVEVSDRLSAGDTWSIHEDLTASVSVSVHIPRESLVHNIHRYVLVTRWQVIEGLTREWLILEALQ